MKKVGKIMLLIGGIGLICATIWTAINTFFYFIEVGVGGNAVPRIASITISAITLLFSIQALVSSIRVFIKDDDKQLKKALICSVIILLLIVFNVITLGFSVQKIVSLVFSIVYIVAAFITKFSKK